MRPTRRSSFTALPSFVFLAVVALGAPSLGGCASQAILSTDHLPVRRVVVYRNGVAYFERGGKSVGSEVRFKMKQSEVGDFLATLAVMEKGGSSVRAAAFPLDHDDPPPADPPRDPFRIDASKKELTPEEEAEAADRKKGLSTVVLSLDGKEHELAIGYVAESPVWRPSYRLVVHADGTADLQAWGIVQNLSGEDWKGVELTLVAGSPLAFTTDLGSSRIPTRPSVSDNGEVVMSIPHGETSLSQRAAPSPAKAAPGAMAAMARPESDTDKDRRGEDYKSASRQPAHGRSGERDGVAGVGGFGALEAPSAALGPPPRVVPSGPRDLRSLAAIAAQGGSTEYRLPSPVTIPDKSATMVMLLSRPVPGEALFLYAPDSGVGDSTSHPFRVARFSNNTGGMLERAPIAVFEGGSFLGQGVVDPLPSAATATVPFALERSIAVESHTTWEELGERVAKIDNGELTVERDQVKQTKYRVQNGGEKPAKVLVKHPRENGARLVNAPKDTDDNVGSGSALVPMKLAPNTTADLVVDERTPVRRWVDWFTPLAEAAVKNLLADPRVPADLATKLRAAWSIRAEIVEKTDALTKVQAGEHGLREAADETRKNLRAIEKNRVAEALRNTLAQRLAETSTKIDLLMRQQVELDAKLAELKVRFKDALRDARYVLPPSST